MRGFGGDFVEVGQPLLQLDDSVQRNARDLLQARLDSDRAYEARLIAERDRRTSIVFPADLEERARDHEDLRAMISGQVGIFEARHASLAGQVEILRNRISQSNVEIDGLKVQRESTFLRYTANTEALQELLRFLYAECCTRNKALKPSEIMQACK